jgi:hypothetical protein
MALIPLFVMRWMTNRESLSWPTIRQPTFYACVGNMATLPAKERQK